MIPGKLSSIPYGEKVFIDSNILTYHLLNDPVYGMRCKDFIKRTENNEYEGFISPIIVSEVLFNFIKATIVKTYGIKPKEVVFFLKSNPKVISYINVESVKDLFKIFRIISISELEVEESYKAIKNYSLLTNDAFHVATMKEYDIKNIATSDGDFERVNWINVWKP